MTWNMPKAAYLTGFLLGACSVGESSPPDQSAMVISYANTSAEVLWLIQSATPDALELLVAEAELGSRGEFESGNRYLGSRTGSTIGKSRYSRPAPMRNDRDCADFASAAAAQRFFLSAGGPTHDVSGLDRDGDGNACEWGIELREVSAGRRLRAGMENTAAQNASHHQCHVGPRGGTYTITAGGYRDYDGC